MRAWLELPCHGTKQSEALHVEKMRRFLVFHRLAPSVNHLAPPFVHYDFPQPNGKSKIVVTADNDLCSGVAGGAIYIIDPSKAVAETPALAPASQ